MPLKYRPDIDGLRAIAVLSVVVFHLGKSVGFEGYLGVDIFFVISGYLITKIIYSDLESGHFSFYEFYKRRIRRVFPMLFVVVACSSLFAALVFLPGELKSYSNSAIASLLFSSNFVFYSEAGYFDVEGYLKPLLHTWSLAIEEQFYIIFPAILLVLYKMRAAYFKQGVWVLLLASLFSSFMFPVLFEDTSFAFYMLPLRAWELLFGSCLALGLFRYDAITERRINVAAFAGIGMIAFGFIIKLPNAYPYSLQVLPVVLGTTLVIWAGSFRTVPIVNAVLGKPVFLFFGRISYSLYLWHWPIFVFLLYIKYGRLSDPERVAIGLVCVLVSYLSWKYVEQPFRRFQFKRPALPILSGLAVSLAIIASASYLLAVDGKVPWVSEDLSNFADVQLGGNYKQVEIFAGQKVAVFGSKKQNDGPNIALIGDSHAEAILPAMDFVAARNGKSGIRLSNACIALLEKLKNSTKLKGCIENSERQIEYIKDHPEIKVVVIAQRWYARTEDWHQKYGVPKNEYLALRYQSLLEFVREISAPDRKVVIMAQVPRIETRLSNIPSMVARMKRREDPTLETLFPTLSGYLNRNKHILSILDDVGRTTGAEIMAIYKALCDTERCQIFDDGGMYYYDDDHLSSYGAKKISDHFEPMMHFN